ncbi:MAG: hypothetical protein J6C89_03830 [Clostridia bacterium]|nr:hypothetical protein [Clostridia bacterium]
MKKIIWNITLASLMTLVAYIALYVVWAAILTGLENPTLSLLLIALMTTVVFGLMLLYTSKIRRSVGEGEVLADYKDRKYLSPVDDLKIIIKRESKTILCIAAIVLVCFALNTFDRLVFEKKTISLPTFFFAPMCLFDSMMDIPFVGYLLSAALDCFAYIVFLLLYRRKKYDYWMKNKV